jgi:hypothetical protein
MSQDKHKQLRDIVRTLAGVKALVFSAEVLSVDEANATIDVMPFESEAALTKVQLAAVDDLEEGLLLIPAVGSNVLVSLIGEEEDEAVVMGYSKLDKVKLKIGESTLAISVEGFTINGGALGGLIKIETLVERINRLEERMLSHQHLSASAGMPTSPDPATNASFSTTQREELEDTKVTH